jgi:glycosyltransferase involved in cell wall biosynthesis
MKWAILVGSPDISGGTYVIFEHALGAVRRGVDVVIVTEHPVTPADIQWHPEARALTFRTFAEVATERFDIAIATWWRTTFELPRVDAKTYAYFVQSIESRFYPESERSLRHLADSTYHLGLPIITEATWIQRHLADVAGLDARLVRNGIRKDLYRADGPAIAPRQPGRLRVLVEGPLNVPFKNVPRSIALCRSAGVDELWLLTGSVPVAAPDVDRSFVRVPIFETGAIYRSCDVLVKLSYVEGMFGPPLEMFHCGGTAITYDVTGHDEYIVNGQNALVATRDFEGQVVSFLKELKTHPALLGRLKQGAAHTAQAWPSWDEASAAFEAEVRAFVAGPPVSRAELARRTRLFMDFYAVAEACRADGVRSAEKRLRDHLVEYVTHRTRHYGIDGVRRALDALRSSLR